MLNFNNFYNAHAERKGSQGKFSGFSIFFAPQRSWVYHAGDLHMSHKGG